MNNKINRAVALMLALQMAAATTSPVLAQVKPRVPMNIASSALLGLNTEEQPEKNWGEEEYTKEGLNKRINYIEKLKKGNKKESELIKLKKILETYSGPLRNPESNQIEGLCMLLDSEIKKFNESSEDITHSEGQGKEKLIEKNGESYVEKTLESGGNFEPYKLNIKVTFKNDRVVFVKDNGTVPTQRSNNIFKDFMEKEGLLKLNNKRIDDIKKLDIRPNSVDSISGATETSIALKKAILNAYKGKSRKEIPEESNGKINLGEGQTLIFKEYDGDNNIIFTSTLPKDFNVNLKSVTYGNNGSEEINNCKLIKNDNDETYTLTIPKGIKVGFYKVNIVDKDGKYNPPLNTVKYNIKDFYARAKHTYNIPNFSVRGLPKHMYHNGRVAEGNSKVIDILNRNIKQIVFATLGNELQVYYPSMAETDNEDNKFYNTDGSINLGYIAKSVKNPNKFSNLKLSDNIEELEKSGLRYIYVFYHGIEDVHSRWYQPSYTSISYPIEKINIDPNPAVIETSKVITGKLIHLKIKLNPEENRIEEVMDNNTEDSGNPGYANYRLDGFNQYKGKTLEEVRKIVIPEGQGTQGKETEGIGKGILAAVIEAFEAHERIIQMHSEAKRELKKLINESYKTKVEIEEQAYENEGIAEFNDVYEKAMKIYNNSDSQDEDFKSIKNELKNKKTLLRKKTKNNRELEEAIENAKSLQKSNYESWSYAFLEKAIEEGTKELEKHLSPKQVKSKVEAIKKIQNNLVEKVNGERIAYKIKGTIWERGTNKISKSMAGKAFNPDLYIEEVGNKTIYHMLFRPIEHMGVEGAEVEALKHIENGVAKEAVVRERKVEGDEYNKVITFIREKQNEKEFVIQPGAYMLGDDITYKEAEIEFDYTKKERISNLEEILSAKAPDLGISNEVIDSTEEETVTKNHKSQTKIVDGKTAFNIPFNVYELSNNKPSMAEGAFESITVSLEGDRSIATIKTKEKVIRNPKKKGAMKGHLLKMFIINEDYGVVSENKGIAQRGEILAESSDMVKLNDGLVSEYPTTFKVEVPRETLYKKVELKIRVIVDIMDAIMEGEPGSGKGSKIARLILNPESKDLTLNNKGRESENSEHRPGTISIEREGLKTEYDRSYALSERDYDYLSWNNFKQKYQNAADLLMSNRNVSPDQLLSAKRELVEARNKLNRVGNYSNSLDGRFENGSVQGAYNMRVRALEADRNEESMAGLAIVNPVTVKIEGNRAFAEVRMQSVNYRGLDGEVQKLYSFSGNSRNGHKIPALQTGNIFKFEVPTEVLDRRTEVWLEVNVDIMDELMGGGYESGNRIFRMIFDPSNKTVFNSRFNSSYNLKDELDREIRSALNYSSRDYEERAWRDFQYVLDKARDIVRMSNPSPNEIDRALRDLKDAKKRLVSNSSTKAINSKNDLENRKVKEGVKTYEVGVSALRADGSGASMAKDAVHSIARVEEKDGKFKYYVSFKPIEKTFKGKTLTGNITKLFYYDGGKYEATNEGSGVWSFTLNSKVEDVKIAVWVDAMDELRGGRPGAGEQDAMLRFNWSSAKELNPEKKEEKKNAINNFYDIQNHWAKQAIEFGIARGYFKGVGDNAFAPNRGMTRGEFVTVIGRIQHIDKNKYQSSKFKDVDVNEFYGPYVNWANEMGIVNGTGNGEFRPNDVMNREQMAVMMAKYLKVAGISVQTGDSSEFKDSAKISGWAKDSVQELAKSNVIKGMGDGTFSPKTPFTRAQVAQVLYNIYK